MNEFQKKLSLSGNAFIEHRYVSLRGKGVSCIGASNNPEVSDKFLNALYEFSPCEEQTIMSLGDKTLDFTGKIPEYTVLASKYKALNKSDLLLKIMDGKTAIDGVKEIFADINYGNFAIVLAIGDNCLFSLNQEEPQLFFDLRKTLGQVFFFPNIETFNMARDKCQEIVSYIGDANVMIFPTHQFWTLRVLQDDPFWETKKYKVNKSKFQDAS